MSKPVATRSSGRVLVHLLTMAVVCTSLADAAPVTGWTERQGLAPVSTMNTASPKVGDGTAESADARSIYASLATVSLTNIGDKVTLSGSATLTTATGTASTASSFNQFRFGLYNEGGTVDTLGWLGYIGSQGHSATGANLLERNSGNADWYMTSAGSTTVNTATAPGTAFTGSTYNFILSLERVATGLQINSSIIRSSDSQQFGLNSFLDTTPLTYDFNRVGFLIGGELNADLVQFTNVDVTFIPVLVETDTDDDGLPDSYEQTIIDANAGDGVDGLEDVMGTGSSPVVTDYDQDGASDAEEFTEGTDPIDSDSDNDGLLDGVENDTGIFVDSTHTGTDPLDPDSDDDSISDGTEVANSTNPNVPGTTGPFLLGIDFNHNDALGAPSQSRFRIISGSSTQIANANSYLKNIGAHQITVSQPGGDKHEFRGANGDSTRAIPGGDTSRSFLVSDFIATRQGAIDIGISGLPAGHYYFRSYHLDTFTGSGLGFAQGASANTPNTIEARVDGVLKDSVAPTALGPNGLNTTFINNGQIPTLGFAVAHDGLSPLVIELRSTIPDGTSNFLLLNGFEILEFNP